jgi:hypothetical protein
MDSLRRLASRMATSVNSSAESSWPSSTSRFFTAAESSRSAPTRTFSPAFIAAWIWACS